MQWTDSNDNTMPARTANVSMNIEAHILVHSVCVYTTITINVKDVYIIHAMHI
jgi:hypothetical protein